MKSLLPREHGTYVQLLAPLIAAFLVASPTIASLLLSVAICAAFLGFEATMIAQGARGARRKAADGARAMRRGRQYAAVVVGAGSAGLLIAPRPAIELALLVALPATLVLVLATRRAIHTLGGELLAAMTLAGAAAPVAAASGLSRTDALAMWLVWSAGFATSVFAVRGVLARHRGGSRRRVEAISVSACAVACGLVIVWPPMVASLPMIVVSAAIAVYAPSAKHLSVAGIALALAAAVSIAPFVASS